MGDYDWIAPLVGAAGSALNSSLTADRAGKISQEAYAEMLRNLQERFGDYDRLGTAGYEQYVPAELGKSALGGITEDPNLRMAGQETLSALKEIIDGGGLSLADLKANADTERGLNRNVTARRKGLANDYAARGQLGAGAQMAMDMDANQQANEQANQRGEATAARAEDRRLSAILKRGDVAQGMSAEDYKRQKEAAAAEDFINRWNASTRNDASKYRNTVKGMAFDDNLSKAHGKTALTDSLNKVTFGKGRDAAGGVETQGKIRNELIKGGTNAASSFGSGGSSGTTDEQTAQDLADEEETNKYDDDF